MKDAFYKAARPDRPQPKPLQSTDDIRVWLQRWRDLKGLSHDK